MCGATDAVSGRSCKQFSDGRFRYHGQRGSQSPVGSCARTVKLGTLRFCQYCFFDEHRYALFLGVAGKRSGSFQHALCYSEWDSFGACSGFDPSIWCDFRRDTKAQALGCRLHAHCVRLYNTYRRSRPDRTASHWRGSDSVSLRAHVDAAWRRTIRSTHSIHHRQLRVSGRAAVLQRNAA